MSESGFKYAGAQSAPGPYVYLENSGADSAAMGLDSTGRFVISRASSAGSSSSDVGQIIVETTDEITLTPTSVVSVSQGHLDVSGVGGYLILPDSDATPPKQGAIYFDGLGITTTIHQAGAGGDNIFVGQAAGNFGSIGALAAENTGVGSNAMAALVSGVSNVAVGYNCLSAASAGVNSNVFVGAGVAENLTSGTSNCCVGSGTLLAATSGNLNTVFGGGAFQGLLTGSNNIGLGSFSGFNYTGAESDNVLISNHGVVGESGNIRIGNIQNGCAIAGISALGGGGTLLGAPYDPIMISADGGMGTLGASTDGQLLIGATGGSPIWATLTAGTNISITNGANSITIDGTGGGTTVTAQTVGAVTVNIISVAVADSTMVTITAVINGLRDSFNDSYGANVTFTVYRPAGGDVTIAGAPIINANNTSTVDVTGTVDVGTQTARLNVVGVAAQTWNWNARYETLSL